MGGVVATPPGTEGNPLWGPDWPRARRLWRLAPGVRHLNHGAYGAVPVPVRRAQAALHRELDANPMRFLRREVPHRLEDARRTAAAWCGAHPSGLAFVPNVTTGVETVLAAAGLRTGDEVLITEHAYGPVRTAVERACGRAGARRRVVPLGMEDDEDARTAALTGAVTAATRLAIVPHITAGTALVLPVARIVPALRERGVAVAVDAAHAPGTVPLAVDGLGADFWLGAFHKWLGAPHGAAALVAAPPWRERLQPLVSGWETGYPAAFAAPGTTDPTARLCVPAAIRLLARLGEERVRRHNRELAAYGARVAAEALGTALPRGPHVSMTAVPLPHGVGTDTRAAKALQDRLAREAAAETTVVSHRGRGWLRLSAHVYNAPADYDHVAGWLRAELG